MRDAVEKYVAEVDVEGANPIVDQATHNKIVSFIWGIADDVLRDLFKRGKYPDVILPMCVIRRMDAVLEPTKKKVLETKKMLDEARITEQRAALCDAAGQAFYNTSKFTLRDLKSRGSQQQLLADFEDYLNGFSPNVQDILDNFKFRNQLQTLSKADAISTLINKFLDPDIDLSPTGVDNHSMGTIFEELVRKFNEDNNEEAGEHWTPRDAVRMMANLVFLPIEAEVKSGTYLLYDCTCGTGGMLTVAEETLKAIASKRSQQVKCLLYGQEINPETYAVCKADMLLKGEWLKWGGGVGRLTFRCPTTKRTVISVPVDKNGVAQALSMCAREWSINSKRVLNTNLLHGIDLYGCDRCRRRFAKAKEGAPSH